MGADKGVHVLDDAIAGSDALATSLVLAEAIKKIGATSGWDLVVCGMASTDGSMGVVPAMLAERLGVPAVTLGSEVDRSTATRCRSAATATPRPRRSRARCRWCCSVTDQSGEARYPSFKGIMAAKKKPVETWSLADLGVDAELVGLSAASDGGRGAPRRARRGPPGRSSPTRTGRARRRWSSSSRRRSSSERPSGDEHHE